MNKFYGAIGYSIEEETQPGVFEPVIHERKYFGDILSLKRNTQNTDAANDTILLNARISVISDPFAKQNRDSIRYVVVDNIKWETLSVDIQFPRMILETGGLYNGPGPESKS